MTRGSTTSEFKIAQFRAHYLYSGNASASARSLKLAESTGRDLARAMAAEPDFVEARRKLRDQYLDDLVALRMRVVSVAMTRYEEKLSIPKSKAGDGPPPVIVDARPNYGKLVLDAERNAHSLAKLSAVDPDTQIPGTTEVHIHLAADDDGDAKG